MVRTMKTKTNLIFPKGNDFNYSLINGGKLRQCNEIKASNGIVFSENDLMDPKNKRKCNYRNVVPTRGNCRMCGQSGPLGHECTHGCLLGVVCAPTATGCDKEDSNDKDKEQHLLTEATDDYNNNVVSKYVVMRTPNEELLIDANFFANYMYKGVDGEPWIPFADVPQNLKKHKELKQFYCTSDTRCKWYKQLNLICKNFLEIGPLENLKKNALHESTA